MQGYILTYSQSLKERLWQLHFFCRGILISASTVSHYGAIDRNTRLTHGRHPTATCSVYVWWTQFPHWPCCAETFSWHCCTLLLWEHHPSVGPAPAVPALSWNPSVEEYHPFHASENAPWVQYCNTVHTKQLVTTYCPGEVYCLSWKMKRKTAKLHQIWFSDKDLYHRQCVQGSLVIASIIFFCQHTHTHMHTRTHTHHEQMIMDGRKNVMHWFHFFTNRNT